MTQPFLSKLKVDNIIIFVYILAMNYDAYRRSLTSTQATHWLPSGYGTGNTKVDPGGCTTKTTR